MVLLTLFRAGQLSCRRTLCGPYICEIRGVALVSNPRLICAAYRGKLNRLFQDEYG